MWRLKVVGKGSSAGVWSRAVFDINEQQTDCLGCGFLWFAAIGHKIKEPRQAQLIHKLEIPSASVGGYEVSATARPAIRSPGLRSAQKLCK